MYIYIYIFIYIYHTFKGFPGGSDGKESACNGGDPGSILGSGRSPADRNTPVFFPGESHRQRSLAGCSPWGHKESDMTEPLHFHFSLSHRSLTSMTVLIENFITPQKRKKKVVAV